MKLYISGPMTGVPEGNHPAFDEAAFDLTEAGHDVVSPADLDRAEGTQGDAASPEEYERRLRRDIEAMADCEAIVFIRGWSDSQGALREGRYAIQAGMAMYEFVESYDRDIHEDPLAPLPVQWFARAIDRERRQTS